MRGLLADFRHAARVYLRTPFASAIAVLALAVAMAFVSAFLSLFNDLALQPHPGFEDAGDLVTVAMSNGDTMAGMSIAMMEDISENVSLIEGVATDQRYFATVIIDGERLQGVPSETVVRRYFPLLRPRMHIGRRFEPADHDPDAEPVVVLSYDFWQRHYGGRRDVLGETLGLEMTSSPTAFFIGGNFIGGSGESAETNVYQQRIVGVLAPGMKGTFQPMTELYFPFEPISTLQRSVGDREPPSVAELYEQASGLTGIGRLSPGATVENLQSALERRYTAADYPLIESRARQGMRISAIPGVHLDLKARRDGLRQVNLFLAATIILALVAACNASLFLLSRAPGRTRELAIRTSLGATTRRLSRQLVTEATLLVVPSVLLGLLASLWLVVVLKDLSLFQTVRWRDVSPIDWRVLGIMAVLTLLLLTVVSIAPVLGLRRLNISAASRTVRARAGWGQKLAGSVQLLAAAVLGSVAIAFGVQLYQYLYADTGFEMDDIVAVQATPTMISQQQNIDFQALQLTEQRVREIMTGLPGVEDVTFTSMSPGQLASGRIGMPRSRLAPGSDTGDSEEMVELSLVQAQPNFTDFLGLRLAHGRSFDDANPTGLLVNETAALLLWGRTDVVGEPVGLFGSPTQSGNEVIGVIRDVYFAHPRDGMSPMLIVSSGSGTGGMMLLKTRSSPSQIRQLVQDRIDAGDVEVELGTVTRLRSVWREIFAADITRILLTGCAALITLLLAAVGSYSTQRFIVAAGRREYAIRAALGAGPRAIGRLVVQRGLATSAIALVLGALLAYITVALLRDDYFSAAISPSLVTAVTAVLLLVLIVGAILAPALQAQRIAPAPLLREE